MSTEYTPKSFFNIEARIEKTRSFPKYPILQQNEVWDGITDLKDQLPSTLKNCLTNDETVIHIHQNKSERPDHPLTALEVVMKAAGAAISEEIGFNGPTVASINPNQSVEYSRYERQHGRDDIYAALDLADIYPQLMYTVADSLADSQGQINERYVPGRPYGFEKPGSIILVNNDPYDSLARKFEYYKGWKPRIYASADATSLYMILLGRIESREPGYLLHSKMRRAFELTTRWLLDRTDENPQCLIEYKNPVPNGGGLRHQGWMDSADALVHENGDWVDSRFGVAALDVQCKGFEALNVAAQLHRKHGNDDLADILKSRSDHLRNFIIENGWVQDSKGSYFAVGWERQKDGSQKRINLKTIDMASPLMGSMLKGNDPRYGQLVRETIRSLCQPDMLTDWGIRTRSELEVSYHPSKYHGGSVWPDKSGRVAAAMSNHGFYDLDQNIGNRTSKIFSTSGVFPEHIEGINSQSPLIPDRDVYVYNRRFDETYLLTLAAPLGQTWAATDEMNRQHRYQNYIISKK